MTPEVLVIGGGLAGSAAAIELARHGVAVTLLERERASSHKVCGEFLSSEALQYLQHLGIDLSDLGAIPLHTVRLASGEKLVEKALPFAAMSLTRRRLDCELLRKAEQNGVRVLRGCGVDRLTREGDVWLVSFASGQQMRARAVFLACGKHDLRGYPRPEGKQRGMVAFKMYFRLHSTQMHALGSAVELITYGSGYAGLQPVEGGLANLCCLVHRDRLRALAGKWEGLLAHMCEQSTHLRQRLTQAEPQLGKPLTVAAIPYGLVRRSSEGLWYLGDQAAVIPSFTGDGMSLALHTGMLAARMFVQRSSANTYQQSFAKQVTRQVAIATATSRVMVAFPTAASLITRLWPNTLAVVARQTRIR